MKSIRLNLTDEQKNKLSSLEKKIAKTQGAYAIFAQIRYPDGEMAVVLVTGKDAHEIREALQEHVS